MMLTVHYYFYLARCSDDSLYAGTCLNLKEREAKHNEGKGAKYTRSRRPISIIYSEEFATLSESRRREAQVKTWKKKEKENLVLGRISLENKQPHEFPYSPRARTRNTDSDSLQSTKF